MKILLKNIEKSDYTGSIQDYIREGGYTAISEALKKMTPEQIIKEVKK